VATASARDLEASSVRVGDGCLGHHGAGATVLANTERGGVGLHLAAGAFVLGITIVRLSGQANAARTGTLRSGSTGTSRPLLRLITAGIIVDDQMAEGVREEPGAVPGREPVGDDILRFTDPGLGDHRTHRFGQWWARAQRGSIGRNLPSVGSPTQISTPSPKARYGRQV
jgi:hypothetical protein